MGITVTNLTYEQFDLLQTTVDWNIDEVPPEHWNKIPGLQRIQDTFAIMASGSSTNPQLMNDIDNIVAGIDVFTLERNPKINKGEGEGNAYHYVFQLTGNPNYPYKMHGPFTSEAVVPHWFDSDNLDNYWKSSTDK